MEDIIICAKAAWGIVESLSAEKRQVVLQLAWVLLEGSIEPERLDAVQRIAMHLESHWFVEVGQDRLYHGALLKLTFADNGPSGTLGIVGMESWDGKPLGPEEEVKDDVDDSKNFRLVVTRQEENAPPPPPAPVGVTYKLPKELPSAEVIQACLDKNGGSVDKTWRELGLNSRHVLRRLCLKYKLRSVKAKTPVAAEG